MVLSRRELSLGLAACVALPFAVPGVAQATSGGSLIRYEAMGSAHAAPRNVTVWLPPGYEASTQRYPVIYMHDGQNILSPAFAFRGQEWGVDEAIAARLQQSPGAGAIVVGIWNTPKRRIEYSPAGVEAALPKLLRDRVALEHGGASLADGYLRFIVHELKPLIDSAYRTMPSRAHTHLMGASMGGLISLYGLCEYPQIFGGAGCLSTHWPMLSAPESYSKPDLETPTMIAGFEAYLAAKLPKPGRHKIWMDHGTINLDSFYGPYQIAIDRFFESQKWRRGVDFQSKVYPGADHNEGSWRVRLHEPLNLLLGEA